MATIATYKLLSAFVGHGRLTKLKQWKNPSKGKNPPVHVKHVLNVTRQVRIPGVFTLLSIVQMQTVSQQIISIGGCLLLIYESLQSPNGASELNDVPRMQMNSASSPD